MRERVIENVREKVRERVIERDRERELKHELNKMPIVGASLNFTSEREKQGRFGN